LHHAPLPGNFAPERSATERAEFAKSVLAHSMQPLDVIAVRRGRRTIATDFICGIPEFVHTDADRMDVELSTIAMSKMGTLIAPANPMIVSTNASMMAPPCGKRSVLTKSGDEPYAERGGFDNRPRSDNMRTEMMRCTRALARAVTVIIGCALAPLRAVTLRERHSSKCRQCRESGDERKCQ
jgi:hypothetical protein